MREFFGGTRPMYTGMISQWDTYEGPDSSEDFYVDFYSCRRGSRHILYVCYASHVVHYFLAFVRRI